MKAYSAKKLTTRKNWMTKLVSHSAALGAPAAFSRARKAGITPFFAAECMTSAASIDQDR